MPERFRLRGLGRTRDAATATLDPEDDEVHIHLHSDPEEDDDLVEQMTETISHDTYDPNAAVRDAARNELFDRQQLMQRKLAEMNASARVFWGGRR